MLVGDGVGAQRLVAAHVVLPPGGGLPEHSHGDSEALVVPLAGELVMTSGRGEQVRLDNPTGQPARMLALFAPPTFSRVLGGWPIS